MAHCVIDTVHHYVLIFFFDREDHYKLYFHLREECKIIIISANKISVTVLLLKEVYEKKMQEIFITIIRT